MRYSAEAHIYFSAQPSVFSHIVINVDVSTFFYSSIKRFLCEVVVAESCLLSSDKKNETMHGVDTILWMILFLLVVMH